MANGNLAGIREDEWESLGDTPPVAQKLIPEQAPGGATVTMMGAAKILGLSKSGIRGFLKTGRLKPIGIDANGWRMFDRAEVDELAADRDSRKGDRMLAGSSQGKQRQLEKEHGISTDPRLFERDARGTAERQERLRIHEETLAHERARTAAIEDGFSRIVTELRATRRACEATENAVAALNTGALVAGLVAAVSALVPDDVKKDLKDKVDGFVRPDGPNGEVARTAAALAAGPSVSGPVQELLDGKQMSEEERTKMMNEFFDDLRRRGAAKV
jgi:DNA-binding transcriptional MerR regulator